ncbi:MAG: hypothetical protein M3I19_01585 [Lancefieldella parvula]|uniref:Uncharacterized protein n=1 Tax=Lancefieldella parvula TaxID=1382 RepID=A0A9E7ANQ5_9ACTN|nr:MAG: hypothetical protein M3I19_01585 [Lancefieldella parvula]
MESLNTVCPQLRATAAILPFEAANQDLKAVMPGHHAEAAATAGDPRLSQLQLLSEDMRAASLGGHARTPKSWNHQIGGRSLLPPIELCRREFVPLTVTQVDKSRFVAQQQIEKLQMLYDSLAQEYFGD